MHKIGFFAHLHHKDEFVYEHYRLKIKGFLQKTSVAPKKRSSSVISSEQSTFSDLLSNKLDEVSNAEMVNAEFGNNN